MIEGLFNGEHFFFWHGTLWASFQQVVPSTFKYGPRRGVVGPCGTFSRTRRMKPTVSIMTWTSKSMQSIKNNYFLAILWMSFSYWILGRMFRLGVGCLVIQRFILRCHKHADSKQIANLNLHFISFDEVQVKAVLNHCSQSSGRRWGWTEAHSRHNGDMIGWLLISHWEFCSTNSTKDYQFHSPVLLVKSARPLLSLWPEPPFNSFDWYITCNLAWTEVFVCSYTCSNNIFLHCCKTMLTLKYIWKTLGGLVQKS